MKLFSGRSLAAGTAATIVEAEPLVKAETAPVAASPSKRMRRVGTASLCFHYTVKTWMKDPFPAMRFLETAHRAGAEVAMAFPGFIDPLGDEQSKQLRARAEQLDVMLEVHGGDAFRRNFPQTLDKSAALGVKVVGCSFGMLLRPDVIPTLELWDAHLTKCEARLRELEAIARRYGLTIGVENHLDFTTEELYQLIRKLDSPHVGVVFDIGNAVGTLDDPLEAADLYGPYVVATHYKDFAIEEVARGFRFTMVPLGTGSLRLPEITKRLQKHVRAEAGYSIEMISGQQFEVPWLEDRFWPPYRDKTARQVAATLRHIRSKATDITEFRPEAELEKLPHEQYVKLEFDRAGQCIRYLKELLRRQAAATKG